MGDDVGLHGVVVGDVARVATEHDAAADRAAAVDDVVCEGHAPSVGIELERVPRLVDEQVVDDLAVGGVRGVDRVVLVVICWATAIVEAVAPDDRAQRGAGRVAAQHHAAQALAEVRDVVVFDDRVRGVGLERVLAAVALDLQA